MEETGRVVESGDGELTIEFTRSSACRNCTASGLCLSLGPERARLRVVYGPGLEVGRRVLVRLPGKAVVWGSFVVFIWPVLALIGMTLIGYLAADKLGAGSSRELWAVVSGLTGLVLSFLLVRRYDRRLSRSDRYRPAIVEIID